ncbi:MAG: ATP-binding protein, partial [Ferruginibacter sp.]
FRAVQEIITNAIKYSTAKEILIDITQKEKLLAIKIADNGTGFDFEKLKNKSYGLSNIQNRVAEINGSLKVETSDGKGTTYFIEILF